MHEKTTLLYWLALLFGLACVVFYGFCFVADVIGL